jgi:muramoyltetrapeptide carboxypeptidase
MKYMVKLKMLKPGDRVGLVAPGSTFSREKFNNSVKALKEMGLVPVYGSHLFSKDFIFAGTVAQRTQNLRTMLNRKDIKAIWCVRGGGGSYAVAEELAKDKKPKHSKIIIGMSDVTALHLLFIQKWKWPVLHGPLFDRIGVAKTPSLEKSVLKKTLFDEKFRLKITGGLKSLGKSGKASGVLVGGNLVLLTTSLGSSWEVDTRGKILFLEEIGERAYRLERFLTQLKTAGKFDGLKGVVIGDFTECNEPDGRELWKTVLKRHFGKSKIPVLMGVHSGHGAMRLTLPMGVKVRINTGSKKSFEVIEGFGRGV